MTKALTLLPALVLLVSCQKEITDEVAGGSASSLPGTYRFTGMRVNTMADGSVRAGADVLRFVTFSSYNTTSNSGTLRLTEDSAFTSNLAYSVSSTAMAYQYLNGQVTDTIEFPFSGTVPPSSGRSRYRMVGTDSIFFENGFLNNASGTTPTQPSGVRFRIVGNGLTFIQRAEFSTVDNSTGVPVNMRNSLNADITFEKQ